MTPRREFVAYLRLNGHPMEEQVACLELHIREARGVVVEAFEEDETQVDRGRPQFSRTLRAAEARGTPLLLASFRGLSKNVELLRTLQKSAVSFLACDFPHANEKTIEVLTALAEYEAGVASDRIKRALAAYKARGGKLGAARAGGSTLTVAARKRGARRASEARRSQTDAAYRTIVPLAANLREAGLTLKEIARRLNEAGHLTRRGMKWNAVQVSRILKRYDGPTS
jgi:DNA invertase Pin-like site-specific DNA recombinase